MNCSKMETAHPLEHKRFFVDELSPTLRGAQVGTLTRFTWLEFHSGSVRLPRGLHLNHH